MTWNSRPGENETIPHAVAPAFGSMSETFPAHLGETTPDIIDLTRVGSIPQPQASGLIADYGTYLIASVIAPDTRRGDTHHFTAPVDFTGLALATSQPVVGNALFSASAEAVSEERRRSRGNGEVGPEITGPVKHYPPMDPYSVPVGQPIGQEKPFGKVELKKIFIENSWWIGHYLHSKEGEISRFEKVITRYNKNVDRYWEMYNTTIPHLARTTTLDVATAEYILSSMVNSVVQQFMKAWNLLMGGIYSANPTSVDNTDVALIPGTDKLVLDEAEAALDKKDALLDKYMKWTEGKEVLPKYK